MTSDDRMRDVARTHIGPETAVRIVGGHRYVLTYWPAERWATLPESRRPAEAQRLGTAGWFDLQPE